MNAAATFYDPFGRALWEPAKDALPAFAAQPAFAVYRNTVMKGCIDALQANFPSVATLVGEAWFRSAAALYVRMAPPRDPRLLTYGLMSSDGAPSFAQFLRDFEPAASLPYLPGVAVLDASWVECHAAADAQAVNTTWLTSLTSSTLSEQRLAPHPAARWHWFDDLPIATLWSSTRAGNAPDDTLVWQSEGLLLTRPADTVQHALLSRAGFEFLNSCARGDVLGEAANSAAVADPDADIASVLALMLRQGALLPLNDSRFSP